MIPETFRLMNTPVVRDDPIQKMVNEHWDLLEQEINCWRMYGYIVEFVMGEIQLHQPNEVSNAA